MAADNQLETTGLGDGWDECKFGNIGNGKEIHFQRYLRFFLWEILTVIRIILEIFIPGIVYSW